MSLREHFNGFHPVVKLIFDVIIVILSGLVFFAVGIFFVALFNLYSVTDFISVSSSSQDMTMFKELQMIYSVSFFLLPPFVIAFLYQKNIFDFFGLRRSPQVSSLLLVPVLIVVLLPFINWTMLINSSMHFPQSLQGLEEFMRNLEEKAKVLTQLMLYSPSVNQLILNLIIIALLPALGEELFFRGILQKHLIEWLKNDFWGILTTAFIFSAFHMQFLSFLPRFILGIVLGYLFVSSKSLWLNIVAHFTNNALAVVSFFVLAKKGISPDALDTWGISAISVSFSLIMGLVLFLYIIKKEKQHSI